MIKDRLEELKQGKTLNIKYWHLGVIKSSYVKMDGDGNIRYKNQYDEDWDMIEYNPEVSAALLDSSSGYSLVNEYFHSYSEAIDALFNKGATITSEYSERYGKFRAYTYHLNSEGVMVDKFNTSPNLTKEEYLGKWTIEYPKKEE